MPPSLPQSFALSLSCIACHFLLSHHALRTDQGPNVPANGGMNNNIHAHHCGLTLLHPSITLSNSCCKSSFPPSFHTTKPLPLALLVSALFAFSLTSS